MSVYSDCATCGTLRPYFTNLDRNFAKLEAQWEAIGGSCPECGLTPRVKVYVVAQREQQEAI